MAEERIFIAKLGGRNGPVETNDNICLLGCSCESCNGGLSRQEAIERMAKAIKSVPKASGEVVYWQNYEQWAEADFDNFHHFELEIIGNIHENSELLEEVK